MRPVRNISSRHPCPGCRQRILAAPSSPSASPPRPAGAVAASAAGTYATPDSYYHG